MAISNYYGYSQTTFDYYRVFTYALQITSGSHQFVGTRVGKAEFCPRSSYKKNMSNLLQYIYSVWFIRLFLRISQFVYLQILYGAFLTRVAGVIVVGEVVKIVGLFPLCNQVLCPWVAKRRKTLFARFSGFHGFSIFFTKKVSLLVLLETHLATESLSRCRWRCFQLRGGSGCYNLTTMQIHYILNNISTILTNLFSYLYARHCMSRD